MKTLSVEEHELACAGLPGELAGLRILQVSDLHMAGWTRGRERAAARAMAGVAPDLVVLTGDYVNRRRYWGRLGEWLATALPPAPRFAVPGNWDYRADPGLEAMERALGRAGVRMLVNDSAWMPRGGGGVRVVGIDDVRSGALDLDRALRAVRPGEFVVAACHSPDILLHLDHDRFDLLLTGHTHGGQVRLPRYGAFYTSTRLGRRYDQGLYEVDRGRFAYVSRGIGTGFIPFRILCPPELALFRLRPILNGPG